MIFAKIKQTFPNEEPEKIFSILNNSSERNDQRTQLAILKLSEGNLENLYHALEAAKSDWRDVLARANKNENKITPRGDFPPYCNQ